MQPKTKRLLMVALLGLIGCATTTLLSTWKDPATHSLAFKKIVVFAPLRDAALRREAEDTMVQQIHNATAIQSYKVFPDGVWPEDAAVRSEIQRLGFDGAVVMRLVSVDQTATWVPGTWSGSYYAYSGWPAYDPGYTQIDTYVRIETNVYTVADQKLIWAAASYTANPSSVHGLIKETADAIRKEMQLQHLL